MKSNLSREGGTPLVNQPLQKTQAGVEGNSLLITLEPLQTHLPRNLPRNHLQIPLTIPFLHGDAPRPLLPPPQLINQDQEVGHVWLDIAQKENEKDVQKDIVAFT